jgi:hypothetical protein
MINIKRESLVAIVFKENYRFLSDKEKERITDELSKTFITLNL